MKGYIYLSLVIFLVLLLLQDSNNKEKKSVYNTCLKEHKVVELTSRLNTNYSVAGSQRLIHKINEVTRLCNIRKDKHVSI